MVQFRPLSTISVECPDLLFISSVLSPPPNFPWVDKMKIYHTLNSTPCVNCVCRWREAREERTMIKRKPLQYIRNWAFIWTHFYSENLEKAGANELLNWFAIFEYLFFEGRSMGRERNLKWIEICELRHMLRVQLTWVTFSMLLNWVLNEAVLWQTDFTNFPFLHI